MSERMVMAMAKLEVWPLDLQGFAIVTTETAARLRLEYEPYIDIEQTPTWGDFRMAGHPFDIANEIIDNAARGDLEDYVAAVESANAVDEGTATFEERWRRACTLAQGPAPDSEAPTDDEIFAYQHGEYGADIEWLIALQKCMLDDLPDEVLDQFKLRVDGTSEWPAGLVPTEQLDDVKDRLVELGYEFA